MINEIEVHDEDTNTERYYGEYEDGEGFVAGVRYKDNYLTYDSQNGWRGTAELMSLYHVWQRVLAEEWGVEV